MPLSKWPARFASTIFGLSSCAACGVRHVAVWCGGMCMCMCMYVACGVWRVACGVWRVLRRRGTPPRGLQEAAGAARCRKMGVAGLGRRDGRDGGRGGGRGACCANERAVSNMAFSSSDRDDESASGSCQSKVCVVDTARCDGCRGRRGAGGGPWRRAEGG
eukprot:scaffold130211_cov39-Phaeocystis_antarctica.AAC.1